MYNFKDIKTNNTYQTIIGDSYKYYLDNSDISYDLSKIKIISNSLIFGTNIIALGKNIFLNEFGELNYNYDLSFNSSEISGNFSNALIIENSLTISKLETIENNNLYTSDGLLLIGNNLSLNNNTLQLDSGGINVSPGLNSYKNPSTINSDGIYFLDTNSFLNINYSGGLDRIYIINNKGNNNIVYIGNIPVYDGEICLINSSQKIYSNYNGFYDYDEQNITNILNDKYTYNDITISNIEKVGTENNPIIYIYTNKYGLQFEIYGSNDILLTEDINYTYLYNSTFNRYEISFISGSNSPYLGTYEPDGINLTANDLNTTNGLYRIFAKEYNQISKKIYEFNINSTKSIILYNDIITLPVNTLEKTGNFFDISIGNNITINSITIGGTLYTLDSTYDFIDGTITVNSNGDYTLILNKKSFISIPEIEINALDENFVSDEGTRSFDSEYYIPSNLPELKINNSETTNINIFDFYNFYGESILITDGNLENESINGFGTITLTANGDLTIIPTEFSTESLILNITILNQYQLQLPIKLIFNNSNSSNLWKFQINGCFSEIKYKDSIDPQYKTLDAINGVTSITRIPELSSGDEISEKGTFYDGNYWRGTDNLFLTIEDNLLDPSNSIEDREYTSSSLSYNNGLPISCYQIEFLSNINLQEILISPAVNDNKFMPLPSQFILWKSLDNGNSWLEVINTNINESNIPNEWYPYIISNKLEALLNTGGFFRLQL